MPKWLSVSRCPKSTTVGWLFWSAQILYPWWSSQTTRCQPCVTARQGQVAFIPSSLQFNRRSMEFTRACDRQNVVPPFPASWFFWQPWRVDSTCTNIIQTIFNDIIMSNPFTPDIHSDAIQFYRRVAEHLQITYHHIQKHTQNHMLMSIWTNRSQNGKI